MVCTVFSYGEGINTSQSHFSYILMCKNENLMNKLFLIILAFSMRAVTFEEKRVPLFLKNIRVLFLIFFSEMIIKKVLLQRQPIFLP